VPVLPEDASEAELIGLQRAMLDELLKPHRGAPLVFWYYTPLAVPFSDHVTPYLCVYDCMDELSAFRGASPMLAHLEQTLFERAQVVFTGGQSLFEAKRDQHPNVYAMPSSIDTEHFGRARGKLRPDPPDQAGLPPPRLGFFGVIDERLDSALVRDIAMLRPAWQIIMIGPVVKIDPDNLPRMSNIYWLGAKDYDQLPEYLGGWHVGLMPFAINEATRFISPTKTPEFLAAGVPVVSTPIVDVIRPYGERRLVEIAADGPSFVARVEHLLQRPKANWLRRVDRHLANMSWDKTWRAMHALMRQAARAGEGPAIPTSTSVSLGRTDTGDVHV
jgi:UDP-galactopyranose mutase